MTVPMTRIGQLPSPDGPAITGALDAWASGWTRPTRTVHLVPDPATFAEQLAVIEAAADHDDPSAAESALVSLAALREQWDAGVLDVTVRQLTSSEVATVARRAARRSVGAADAVLHLIAEAIVTPGWDADALQRLRDRDLSGEAQVALLLEAVETLRRAGQNLPADVEAMHASIARSRRQVQELISRREGTATAEASADDRGDGKELGHAD